MFHFIVDKSFSFCMERPVLNLSDHLRKMSYDGLRKRDRSKTKLQSQVNLYLSYFHLLKVFLSFGPLNFNPLNPVTKIDKILDTIVV